MRHHSVTKALNYFGFKGNRAAISFLYARPEGASQNEVNEAGQALGSDQKNYLNMLHQALNWGHQVCVWDDDSRGGKVYKLVYNPNHNGPGVVDPPENWRETNVPKTPLGVMPTAYGPRRSVSPNLETIVAAESIDIARTSPLSDVKLDAPFFPEPKLGMGAIGNHAEGGGTVSDLLGRIRRDLSTDYYQQNFSNEGQRFLAWYLRNCYNRTAIQARDDITDGQNDKEIDAVIIDEEKREIIIIQSKFFAGSVDHQPLHDVLSTWLQIKHLAALQENCNSRLQVKLETVAAALAEEYEVVFELVTTGKLTADAQKELSLFVSAVSEFEHPEASLTLVDSDLIQTRWTEAAGRELPKLTHEITFGVGKYLAVDIANCKTVLATIPLAECLRMPGIADGKLFRPNVRQSLGLTNKINKGRAIAESW
jgi:hypothetical protein